MQSETTSCRGYNTKGATLTNLSVYGLRCLSRFQILASMLSPSDSICSGGGGTDGGSNGGSGLDLLRDEDGNSDESSGCWYIMVQLSIGLWLLCSLVVLGSPFLVDWQGQG
ncbi:hypothetical protein Tco_1218987 [Tanacetum coccineum]